MTTRVIIPWRDQPDRRAAAAWVEDRLRRHGHAPMRGEVAAHEPWSKGAAVAHALGEPTSVDEVVVVHDADVWSDGLHDAILAVVGGRFHWAVPHRTVRRLDADETTRELGLAWPPRANRLERHAYTGVMGGGIVVIRRALYDEAPFDRRFIGWGQEDVAAGATWRALGGAPWRGNATLWHLHHEPEPKLTSAIGSRESQLLCRRYVRAAQRRDTVELRSIIKEA